MPGLCRWQCVTQKQLIYFIALHFLKLRFAASAGVYALAHEANNTMISA